MFNFVLELHSASPKSRDQALRSLYSHSNGAAVNLSWQMKGGAFEIGSDTLLEEIEEGDEGEAILSRKTIAALSLSLVHEVVAGG